VPECFHPPPSHPLYRWKDVHPAKVSSKDKASPKKLTPKKKLEKSLEEHEKKMDQILGAIEAFVLELRETLYKDISGDIMLADVCVSANKHLIDLSEKFGEPIDVSWCAVDGDTKDSQGMMSIDGDDEGSQGMSALTEKMSATHL